MREDRAGRQAAELLRQPAPAGLADRVWFAVELAAASATPRRGPYRVAWSRRGRIAAAGALALGLAVTLAVLLLPGRSSGLPAPVAAVVGYAATVPQPARQTGPGGRPTAVKVGHPVTLTAGGQSIVVQTWRMDGTDVVVATSGRPFPMPPGAQGGSARGMAWSARSGKISLYCINGRTSELMAAPVPGAELAALAARLPLA